MFGRNKCETCGNHPRKCVCAANMGAQVKSSNQKDDLTNFPSETREWGEDSWRDEASRKVHEDWKRSRRGMGMVGFLVALAVVIIVFWYLGARMGIDWAVVLHAIEAWLVRILMA